MSWPIAPKVFSSTVGATGTSSSGIEFGQGWNTIWVEIPTMASATTMHVLCAKTIDGTYRRMTDVNSCSVAAEFQVNSTRNHNFVRIPAGLPFMKMECLSAPAVASTFYFYCS